MPPYSCLVCAVSFLGRTSEKVAADQLTASAVFQFCNHQVVGFLWKSLAQGWVRRCL